MEPRADAGQWLTGVVDTLPMILGVQTYHLLAKVSTTLSALVQVWESVRGGVLDSAAANNMMTYAADVTGFEQLDFGAFQKLVSHFS